MVEVAFGPQRMARQQEAKGSAGGTQTPGTTRQFMTGRQWGWQPPRDPYESRRSSDAYDGSGVGGAGPGGAGDSGEDSGGGREGSELRHKLKAELTGRGLAGQSRETCLPVRSRRRWLGFRI